MFNIILCLVMCVSLQGESGRKEDPGGLFDLARSFHRQVTDRSLPIDGRRVQ